MKQHGLPPPDGPPAIEPMSYRRLLHWSLIVVSGAPYLFVASLAITVTPILLVQYSVWLLAQITSALGGGVADQGIGALVARYGVVSLLIIATQYYGRIVTIHANGAMLGALQQRLHDRLLAMPTAFHDTHNFGETSTIVLQDAAGCQPILCELIASPVTQGVGLVSALIFLFRSLDTLRDVPVTAQILLAAVLILVPPLGQRLSSNLRQAYASMRAEQAALATEFANSAAAPLEIRLLNARAQRMRAFRLRLGKLVHARILAATRTERTNQFQLAVPSVLQLAVLVYAAVVAARANAPAAGAILSIYYFVPKVIEPADQIARFLGGLGLVWVQAARMGAVLDAPVEPPRTVGTTIDAAPEVALEQVEFRYPGAPAPTLRDVTHVFPAGRISAIIGRSGSGKSSLFGLIDGLRMPDRGVVRIAGQSVAALGEAGLRETVAVVSQTPLLIADTVRANFQLARADATDAQIEAAARTAGLWPALLKLGGDRVLDIPISPTPGQGLSGGERKLLAVARVLLCQPRVLLLDEPTTGVDLVSIGTLLDALRTACSGMTVIMIEHNLDFVRGLADEVCCLVDGRFADIGSPAELAARPSLFRDLLAARERLVDTTSLQLRSVRLPSLSGGDAADPWAPPAVDGPAGEPPRITLLRKP